MEEKLTNESGATRRTIIQGAAWSVPIFAVATAASATAASTDCPPGEQEVTAVSTTAAVEKRVLFVDIPACATRVFYEVRGGAGGSSGHPGGAGAYVTGELIGAAGTTVTLVAGSGGQGRGHAKQGVRPTGYGDGGVGGIRFYADYPASSGATTGDGDRWWLDGGSGGAGSAILMGGETGSPLVVAGGGGGGANAKSWNNDGATAGAGGAGGLTAGTGTNATRGGGLIGYGGQGATLTTPGAGGLGAPASPTYPARRWNGNPGGSTGWGNTATPVAASGDPRNGGYGRYFASGDPTGSGVASGGGGGGYMGGGSGSIISQTNLDGNNNDADDGWGGGGAGGGAGSTFVSTAPVSGVTITGTPTTWPERRGVLAGDNNGYPGGESWMGLPGHVRVWWE